MNGPFEVRQSPIHGTGVFAARDIRAGEKIVRYLGRLITHDEADSRDDTGHTFLFTLNERWVVDAGTDGNEARWVNHSCDPNCEVEVYADGDDPRADEIWIEAIRDIRAGEELTYDYNIRTEEEFDEELTSMWRCRCGAATCRGLIILPSSDEEE